MTNFLFSASADDLTKCAICADRLPTLDGVVIHHVCATAPEDDLRAALRKVLTDWGLNAITADPPHSWRCQYPQLRDQVICGHVDDLLDDLCEAVRAEP